MSAQVSGRTLGLQLLGGTAFTYLNAIGRLRKRLRILPLTWATLGVNR